MSPGGGAASGNLADLVVAFVLKGREEMKAAIDQLKEQISAFGAQVNALGDKMQASMKQTTDRAKEAGDQAGKLGEAFKRAGDSINIALGAGVAVVGNFVRQGLAAGAMGQVLQFQMERLALTISGLFRPEIQKVSELITRLTNWIQGLSEAQKKSIAYWLEGAAAALAVGLVLPRIVAGIQAIIVATKALGAAIAGAEAMTGIGAILPVLGLVAQGLTALLIGTEGGREALGKMFDAFKTVSSAAKELWDALQLGDVFDDLIESALFAVNVFAQMVQQTAELVKWIDKLAAQSGFLASVLKGLFSPLAIVADLNKQLFPTQKKDEGSRGADMHRTGGFEDLNATYRRIAVASMRASAGLRSPEERTAANTEQALQELRQINSNTGRPPSSYAP